MATNIQLATTPLIEWVKQIKEDPGDLLTLERGSIEGRQGLRDFLPLVTATSCRYVEHEGKVAIPLDFISEGIPNLMDEVARGYDLSAINVQDENGDTALHHAARMGLKPVVELLISYGADPNIRNHKGENPLESAVRNDNLNYHAKTDVVYSLLRAGANSQSVVNECRLDYFLRKTDYAFQLNRVMEQVSSHLFGQEFPKLAAQRDNATAQQVPQEDNAQCHAWSKGRPAERIIPPQAPLEAHELPQRSPMTDDANIALPLAGPACR